ncbi:MAG: histidine kinase [Lachnospiraceae bacterium]|nr:histidine kinase [Lachnospiraceae bacterium]
MKRQSHKGNVFKGIMDDLTVRSKLIVLFVFCVLLPLFVTDGIILSIISSDEQAARQTEMKNLASAVEADFRNTVEGAVRPTTSLFINRAIYEFMDREYESSVDYYTARYELLNEPFANILLSSSDMLMTMYTDNPTIISGGAFVSIISQEGEEWLKAVNEKDRDVILESYYMGDDHMTETVRKRLAIVRHLDHYKDFTHKMLVKVDIDYSKLVRRFNEMHYSMPVYICEGDKILYSTEGYTDLITPFAYLDRNAGYAYENKFELYGLDLRILVFDSERDVLDLIKGHLPLLMLLLSVNIMLPTVLMYMINVSFTDRLRMLSSSFDNVNNDMSSLEEIGDIHGRDEIGSLMKNYNRMVVRLKELIRTVYEERLRKQEIDIERQQAELLALHSQINPHFLFNVLESIRMHSIIKGEGETADMIERLAILQRQNVDWSDDQVRLKEELKFVEAYLELQKYRFGDKLSYNISVRNGCENYYMPRLTLETFVENACVHGAENKAGTTYIYIRVYEQDDRLYMEVEDTGDGMSDEAVEELNERLRTCTIDELKKGDHIGMINACLRLKMHTNNRASVQVESEKGVGTTIFISIPVDTLAISVQ